MTNEDAQALLAELFAPWVQDLGLRVVRAGAEATELVLPFDARLCRAGGTICGQALMAAADTAMVIAIAARLGGFRPMTTVGLTTTFMRPVAAGDLRIVAVVLKPGRSLVFGEIECIDDDGRIAMHATATCALV